MGLENQPQSLTKVLDSFLISDKPLSLETLHRISTLLNAETGSLTKFQQQLTIYTTFASSFEIWKILELFEYLTIFSTQKIASVINDEKFVEYFSSGIMEPEFQGVLLNILKLWQEKYRNDKESISRMYELIENLPHFGIDLPHSFKSKYEDMDPEALFAHTKPEEKPAPPPRDQLPSGGNSDSAKKKVNNSSLIDHIGIMIEDKDKFQDPEFQHEMDLEEFHPLVKIIRPKEEDRNEKSNQKKPGKRNGIHIMSVEDLIEYKTSPCRDGTKCKNAPSVKRGFSLQGLKQEIHCPYWHSVQDRRRTFFDDKGNLLYKITFCKNREECLYGDNCKKSHNFFESFFHPLNYKKKKCTFGRACKNGKYCPYYHSLDEMEAWKNTCKEVLNLKDEEIIEADSEDDDLIYDLDKRLGVGYSQKNDKEENQDLESNGNKNWVNMIKEKLDNQSIGSAKKPCTKQLHGKLIIRTSVISPSQLTSVLAGNSCLNSLPLFMRNNNTKTEERTLQENSQKIEDSKTS